VGEDIAQTLSGLAQRTRSSMVFTVAPSTPALMLLWAVGRAFPRSDRAPAIEPIAQSALERHMGKLPELNGWTIQRSQRVSRSFYISQALEVKRS
jgi:magnesium-protoporphyrin O-methyltransferase